MATEEYFNKAIDWAKNKGITGIKANCEGFEQPTVFTAVGGEEPITPDVTGKKFDSKIYIEIATKTDDVRRQVSKWKLLSTIAEMKGGKLILLAPKGHKAFTEQILKRHNLDNTQLYYLPSIK